MDFWQVHGSHGWLFLILITLFPRLTMLFAVTVPFGWLAWLGWGLSPSLLVAILATTYYGDTNPGLCVIAWFFVFAKGILVTALCSRN
ncbi:MAG: hypothetical protein A2655_03310 [Candidatus Yanofskybacteria bacterium RIFCSPHIGHO2_01_FULL_43_42]|nr:MAG: hypothetical protein A2655_03310 [Candidatus Yanofskybacteria bacterium RIFCSPHIGHO2_01_FULL_43_42]OGN13025.1 MAG: hypothetical protein A3D48_03970 [Candidatus Yanofskybacteria bacterium RIFCSPHIGHO2_02_FULL_43_17]